MQKRLLSKKKERKHSNYKGPLELEFYIMDIQDELADSSDEEMQRQAQPVEPAKEVGQPN